jgi:hypothetical protein
METAYIRWKMARSMKKSLLRRSCAYVRVGATETGGERPYAADERALVAQGAAGISAIEETLQGLPIFGAGGYFSTSNGAIAEDIGLQYLENHIADPTDARWDGCRLGRAATIPSEL